MTNKEAIAHGKEQLEVFGGEHAEFIKLAIQALEKEPCEDAISKASVFEIMGNLMGIPYELDRPITEKDVSESMDEINALPSVTPTRKKAKWIVLKDTYGEICEAICSCCEDNGNHRWKYCHTCGAKMDEEGGEE